MDETTRVKRWEKMRIKKRNPEGSRSAWPCAALPSRGHGRPLDEAGLQALRAHAHLEGGAVACIDPNALEIDQPTTTRVSIRMADGVPCHRAASATLTNLCHGNSPPFFFTRTRMRLPSPRREIALIFASGFYHISSKTKNFRMTSWPLPWGRGKRRGRAPGAGAEEEAGRMR